jgi:hypothetical protein
MIKQLIENKGAIGGAVMVFAFATILMQVGANRDLTRNDVSRPATQGLAVLHDKQVVTIWVHGEDIYPGVVRARPGRVRLRAENETQSDIVLIVERVTTGQARQEAARVHASRNIKRKDQELHLGAGEYIFYEESRPEITGTLIVEPM